MSGILEIAPTGILSDSPRLSRAAKNRSIAVPAARTHSDSDAHPRSFGQSMFTGAINLFHRLAKVLRIGASVRSAHPAKQDRAIAEQDSDIAATAFIARISAVPGAARAAVREEATMSLIATQTVIAAEPRGDMGVRAAWWQPLPQLLSRLRRALHSPSESPADGVVEAVGVRPMQWSFAPQAREFAVSRRRQSGGRVRASRVSRP